MDAAQLRPLRVGEILDAAIRVYRQKFSTMVKAVVIVVLPVQVLNVLVRLSLPSSSTTTTDSTGTVHFNGSAFAATIAGTLVLLVASVVSSTLAQAACFKIVGDTYLGTPSDWRSSLRFGFSKFWRLLGLILLHGLLLLLAFVACVVPGVWLYAAWPVAVPVLLIEGTGRLRGPPRQTLGCRRHGTRPRHRVGNRKVTARVPRPSRMTRATRDPSRTRTHRAGRPGRGPARRPLDP